MFEMFRREVIWVFFRAAQYSTVGAKHPMKTGDGLDTFMRSIPFAPFLKVAGRVLLMLMMAGL